MKSVKEIQEEIESADSAEERDHLITLCEEDSRASVRKMAASFRKKEEKLKRERARLEAMKTYERQYEQTGLICGIDEVGRGPLAGPVVACAVILPQDCDILYLNDSKKLTAARREALYQEIMEKATAVGIGMVSHQRIDEINILQATYEAMRQAIRDLPVRPAMLLNDAVTIPGVDLPQLPIIKGDAKSVSIAAASIVAKVTRDALMCRMDEKYPEYHFASNKGYGTADHLEALRKYGPCPIHRASFIGGILNEKDPVGISHGEKAAGISLNNRSIGTLREQQAEELLRQNGLVILEKNFVCKQGEIDLIASDRGEVVFVEVKYRAGASSGSSLEAVTRSKQHTIISVARFYLARILHDPDHPCRFDVIGFDGERVNWVRNAFGVS